MTVDPGSEREGAPVTRPTRGYLAVAVALALVVGGFVGVLLGFAFASVVVGVLAGVGVGVLVTVAAILAVRRGGGSSRQGAPPWAGHPGDRGAGSA